MSATLQTMRSGGSQHPEEIMNFHTSRIVKGVGGIFDSVAGSFLVSEEAVPAMSVLVAEGYAFIRKASDDMVYPVRLYDGDKSVAISSNSSGNTRIDAIVLYVDLGASANADITNVAKIVVVEGTPSATPSAPSNGDIETAIGASNPYLRLADVTVENGETAILDADITDQRAEVLFISNGTPTADGDVANKKYVDDQDAVTTLTEKTIPVSADMFKLWDSVAGAFKKLSFLNLKKTMLADGWVEIAGTWTASDANSISIDADLTSILQKGDKIKLTNNSAIKYFYVSTAPAFGAGVTTFDVAGEVDLVAGAITTPFYSKVESPQGFKGIGTFRAGAYKTGTQSITNGSTFQKITWDAEFFDPNSNFDLANERYVCPISGFYLLEMGAGFVDVVTGTIDCNIYKNGSEIFTGFRLMKFASTVDSIMNGSLLVQLNKGDYIEFYIRQFDSSAKNLMGNATNRCMISFVGV